MKLIANFFVTMAKAIDENPRFERISVVKIGRIIVLLAFSLLIIPWAAATAQESSSPEVNFHLPPPFPAIQPGEIFDVEIDTSKIENLKVGMIQIEFDPELLQVWDAEKDAAANHADLRRTLPKVIVNKVDNKSGLITFAAFTSSENGAFAEGVMATVTFKAIEKGVCDLTFTGQSQLLIPDAGGEAKPLTVVFKPGKLNIGIDENQDTNGEQR